LTVHSTTRTSPATPNLSRSPTRAARREVALAPVHPRDPKADRHPALSNSHRSLRRSSRTCRNVKVNRYARPPYSRHRSKTRAISPARSKATNAEHLGHDHTEPHAMSPPSPAPTPYARTVTCWRRWIEPSGRFSVRGWAPQHRTDFSSDARHKIARASHLWRRTSSLVRGGGQQ